MFLWGPVFLLVGRLENEGNVSPLWGHFSEHIRVVQQIGSGRIKGDVGCDRMVFAINPDLFLIEFHSKINKWSLDQGQKTINPLIRPIFANFDPAQSKAPIEDRQSTH